MPLLNAETPVAGRSLTEPAGLRALPGWRDLRNYALQLISLAIFFGFGFLLTLASPLVRLLAGKRSPIIGQRLIHALFRSFAAWLEWWGLFRIRYEGIERLRSLEGAIVAPNHPGLLDAVFLVGKMPRAICIMRAGLMQNPCFAGMARLAGYITNDRGAGLIRDCRQKLEAGDNLLIFPEGTRTRCHARGVNPFKSGFALAAVLTGAPIQTVLIERSGIYLGKETGLMTPARIPIEMTIRAGEVFHARPGESAKELSLRLESYFRSRLANTEDGVRLRS